MSSVPSAGDPDTIVAIATPPGKGAIGIIRLSGKDAVTIAAKLFRGKDLTRVNSHTVHLGLIQDGEQMIDQVLASVFLAPNSYTAEDVVELSCHGSGYILSTVIQLFIRNGARMARPGEFTMRAFLNGKMDLAQAEAVADLVASGDEIFHRIAMNQMRGGFSGEIRQMREKLVHFSSLVELELDFSEEDVEFASRKELKSLVTDLKNTMNSLATSFVQGNVIKNGVPTVIAGKPNSGKSTLLNALLNEEKAIVSEIEGTTRDIIEDEIHIEGIAYRFIDTAGIREARDKIEQIGIERTRKKMKEASVILYMFDLSKEDPASIDRQAADLDLLKIPYIKVGNKMDCAPPALVEELTGRKGFVLISALQRKNLDTLKNRLTAILNLGSIKIGDTIVTNARHYESLYHAHRSVDDVVEGLEKNISGEMLAEDIRQAIHYLGEITGEITSDDILSSIFSKFCIGK